MADKCPRCQVCMVKETDYWLCPDCGGEWYPDADKSANDIAAIWKDEERYKRSITILGGGSKNGVKQENKGNKTFTDKWEAGVIRK